MPEEEDYYQLLGVDRNATVDQIKKAYRKKALEWHPDRNKSPQAEEMFKKVTQAYEVLSDPEKRKAYDQFGHAAFQPGAGFRPPGGQTHTYRQGPFTYTYTTMGDMPFGEEMFTDPFEIFEQFFGGAMAGGRRRAARPHYSLKVDFMDAMKGTEKTVVIQGKQHTIKIPPGARDGTRIRYPEFDVTLDVQPHEVFKRQADDIYVDQHISLPLAVLGGVVSVPTIDGPVKIKIRPGTQPDTVIRLSGKGAPRLHGRGRGDEYVRIMVDIPQNLTKEQKKAFEAFAKSLKQN